MQFLIQADSNFCNEVDTAILMELINSDKRTFQSIPFSINSFHQYCSLKEPLKDFKAFEDIKNAIPLGTIEFVDTYFKAVYGIDQMNPIEIPNCLRTEEFLKRKYSIVKASDIPHTGRYFIKDASKAKVFSFQGYMESFLTEDIFDKPKEDDYSLYLDPTHLYQVSELVNILSEYRVYIIGGKIHSITNYNGDPCVFPDTNLIKKANIIYSMQPDYPKSYTMDIMVTDKGTSIIEIHPLFSCGIYQQVFGNSFLYGYRDSKDYVLNHNTLISEFSNFNK